MKNVSKSCPQKNICELRSMDENSQDIHKLMNLFEKKAITASEMAKRSLELAEEQSAIVKKLLHEMELKKKQQEIDAKKDLVNIYSKLIEAFDLHRGTDEQKKDLWIVANIAQKHIASGADEKIVIRDLARQFKAAKRKADEKHDKLMARKYIALPLSEKYPLTPCQFDMVNLVMIEDVQKTLPKELLVPNTDICSPEYLKQILLKNSQ